MKNIYELSNNSITFKFNYNPKIIEEIKLIDGRTYLPNIKAWMVPVTLQNNQAILNIVEKHNFIPTDSLVEINTELELFPYHKKIKNLDLKLIPREYQNFAIDYQLTQKKVINGDDIGLGKTLEAVFACEIGNLFPCVVITLNNVKYHWKNLWLKTNPNRIINVLNSEDKKHDYTGDVTIINYQMLGKRIKVKNSKGEEVDKFIPKYNELFELPLKCVIIDESHFIKSYKSIRGRMASKLIQEVEYVWELTGTPIMNKPSELVHPLNIIGWFNKLFGTWNSFVFRYCGAFKKKIGIDQKEIIDYSGASNLMELNKILKANCYFRREKNEVLKDLPPVQKSFINVDITNLKEYQLAETNLIEYLELNYSVMRAQSAAMAEFLVLRNVLRQLSGKGKVKAIIEYIENFIDSTGNKLVIFGVFRGVLKELSIYFNSKLVDGDLNSREKDEIINDFINNNDQVLFGNMAAMGTGTDGLQEVCSNMLIIELPERPGDIDQVIGRIDRSGQKKSVNVDFLLSELTIDVLMFESLEMKREVTEAVNKGKEFKAKSFNEKVIEYYKKV